MKKVSRTIRFVIRRLNYYDNHLPKDPFHSIIFDIRGQQINNLISDYIIEEIKNKYPRPNSLKIDFVNQ